MRRFAFATVVAAAFVAATPAQVAPPAGIDALLGSLPGVVATYEAKSDLGGVVALDGLTIALKKADGTPDNANKVTIERVEATGLDGEAILTVFDGARYGAQPDQTFRTLFDRLDLRGVAIVAGGRTVATIAGLSAGSLEMKQFWFKPGADMRSQFGSDAEMAAKIVGNLLDSTRTGPSSITGLHVEVDPAIMAAAMMPGVPAPPSRGITTYDYAEISAEGFDRGRWSRMDFKDLSSHTPLPPLGEMSVSIAGGYWDGIDVSKLLPWLMRAEWPPVEREGLVSSGRSCMTSYVLTAPGLGVLDFPEACTDLVGFVWLIPQRIALDMTGTFTPAPPESFIAPPHVARHFQAPMEVGLTMEWAYDPDAGTGTLAHYRFRLGGFGSIDFSATVGGLTLASLPLLPETYPYEITLNAAAIELVDEGGIQKYLEMIAETANIESGGAGQMTPEAMRSQMKAGLDMSAGMLGNTPRALALIQPVKDWLDGGGTLIVRLAPPEPLSPGDVGALAGRAPGDVVEILGVETVRTAP